MAAKVDAVLEALVNHATRHGGDITAITDAWDEYQGNATAAERAKEAQDADDAEQEAGKAKNAKQVEDEKEAAAKKEADKKDGK